MSQSCLTLPGPFSVSVATVCTPSHSPEPHPDHHAAGMCGPPRPSQSLPRVPLNVRGGTSYVHAAPGPRAPLMRHLQTCPDAGSCPQASLFRPVRAEDETLPLRCHTDKCQPSSKHEWVWGAAALRALHPDLLNRRAMSRLDPASWFPTIHVNPAAARRGRNRAA